METAEKIMRRVEYVNEFGKPETTEYTAYHEGGVWKVEQRQVEPHPSTMWRTYTFEPDEVATADQAIDAILKDVASDRDARAAEIAEKERERAEHAFNIQAIRESVVRGEVDPDAIMTAFRCPECAHLFDEEPEEDPRYDCGSCGNPFSRSETDYENHQCPQCRKFGSKLNDSTCPECQEGVDDFEEVRAVEVDGELIAFEMDGGSS